MKTVMNYRGYIIKQVNELDIKKGDAPDYDLGSFCVFTKDNEIEYEAGSIEEAKEQIDGLIEDRKQITSRLAKNVNLNNEVRDPENYKFKEDLNWKDDGDELTDPSMNDYIKGYNIDPYEFKQWASNKKGVIKESAKETDNMQMLPWYLADKILTLWNGSDGPIQNFFEAFTLRYSNRMKTELAKFLDLAGYKVYPVLLQEKPIYASLKYATKIEDQLSIDNLEENECPKCGRTLNDGECKPCKVRYEDFSHIWYEIKASRLAGNIKPFYDMQMSDIVLDKTDEQLSGNKDPVGVNKGSDGPFGYNATDYLNSDTSVPPNQYETHLDGGGWYRGSKLNKINENKGEIPLDDVKIGDRIKIERHSGVYVYATVTGIKGDMISYTADNGDSGNFSIERINKTSRLKKKS